MIKPEYKELKDFPVSNKTSEGIHYIPADFNNITIRALYNIEYVQREIPLYLNILVPEKQYLEDVQKETYPLLVYVQGSAWRKQNVIEHIIPLSNIAKKGFVVAIVQYRDTDIALFPAQIEDTKTAISFLVEHHQDYQIDTKNILFIVGGAFVGLDKIVEHRAGEGTSVGFGAKAPMTQVEKEAAAAKMLKKLQPEDLLKFGLIPEFIGRVPVYAVLDQLNEKTLKMILTEPKNAVVKQYKCLLEMDGVDLEFEPEAIDLIAQEAIKRKTGARALRSIVEEIMLDVMYDVPTKNDIKKFVVTADMVRNRKNAEVVQLPTKDGNNKEISA